MADPNLNRPEWDVSFPEPPFQARAMRLGPRAGCAELGVTLYEIDPGGAISPYHAHHANEELLLVLEGRPALRTPEGTRSLRTGDVVAFPRGGRGAHRIANPEDSVARALVFSTTNFPDVAEHLDTGTMLAMTGPTDGKAFPAGTDVPFVESVARAMHVAADRERSAD